VKIINTKSLTSLINVFVVLAALVTRGGRHGTAAVRVGELRTGGVSPPNNGTCQATGAPRRRRGLGNCGMKVTIT
jgi:hypothetical protein